MTQRLQGPAPGDRVLASLRQRLWRGAMVRLAFGLTMWLFAGAAAILGVLKPVQVVGVTVSLVVLISVGFCGVLAARRISSPAVFGPLSLAINAVEVIALTGVIHFVGGIDATFVVPTYCAVVAYVGVVAPPLYPYLVAGFSSAAFSSVVALEYVGVLAHYPLGRATPLPLLHQVWMTSVVAALLFMIAYLAAGTAASLKAKRERLREERDRLEESVAERTRSLWSANRLLEREVAVRRDAEAAALRSEERYRLLVDDISDIIFSHDGDGRLLDLSPSGAAHFGLAAAQAIGRTLSDFMPPENAAGFRSEYLEALRLEGHHEGVFVLGIDPGQLRYFEYRSRMVTAEGGPSRVSGVARDITERVLAKRRLKALQAQLAQAQKMEAVGTLASGIAHDFNNLLQAISGFVQLMDSPEMEREELRGYLAQVDSAVTRAAALVRRLLTFSRKVQPELRPVDLNRLVDQTVEVLERTIPKMISIRARLTAEPSVVEGDAAQLEQVVLNLAANARDAMPDGGLLEIGTGRLEIGSDTARGRLDVEAGSFVSLTVTDSGGGMSHEVLEHAFEPFYTTKPVGRGTGLGLATVYAVVKAHHGDIRISSEPGRGTSFTVLLPAMDDAQAVVEPSRPEVADSASGRGRTVMVVDDEDTIATSLRRFLEGRGYSVVLCRSGEEALASLDRAEVPVDLVVLDLGMPGMGGLECLRRLRHNAPEVPVVVASGYGDAAHEAQARSAGASRFLAKPYALAEIAAAIREEIARKPGVDAVR